MSQSCYRIGFLMDPYESLNLTTETSLLLMEELVKRNHQVFWMQQEDVHLRRNLLQARTSRLRSVQPFVLELQPESPLAGLDALVIRKDPPFDAGYLQLTYLLDFLDPRVVAINSPSALRAMNEKLYTLNFSQYCPDSLVTMDADKLLAFVKEQGRVIVKPLDNCSGRGIFSIDSEDPQLEDKLATAMRSSTGQARYALAQPFLSAVSQGDKRVFVVNGEPLGWVNRIPHSDQHLANIHQGALCEATSLSEREDRISRLVGTTGRRAACVA